VIDHNHVDCEAMCGYSAELIIKCLNVLYANPLPFYVIKFHLTSKGEFEKESFHGCN